MISKEQAIQTFEDYLGLDRKDLVIKWTQGHQAANVDFDIDSYDYDYLLLDMIYLGLTSGAEGYVKLKCEGTEVQGVLSHDGDHPSYGLIITKIDGAAVAYHWSGYLCKKR